MVVGDFRPGPPVAKWQGDVRLQRWHCSDATARTTVMGSSN